MLGLQPEDNHLQTESSHQTPSRLAPWLWTCQSPELGGMNVCWLSHTISSICCSSQSWIRGSLWASRALSWDADGWSSLYLGHCLCHGGRKWENDKSCNDSSNLLWRRCVLLPHTFPWPKHVLEWIVSSLGRGKISIPSEGDRTAWRHSDMVSHIYGHSYIYMYINKGRRLDVWFLSVTPWANLVDMFQSQHGWGTHITAK